MLTDQINRIMGMVLQHDKQHREYDNKIRDNINNEELRNKYTQLQDRMMNYIKDKYESPTQINALETKNKELVIELNDIKDKYESQLNIIAILRQKYEQLQKEYIRLRSENGKEKTLTDKMMAIKQCVIEMLIYDNENDSKSYDDCSVVDLLHKLKGQIYKMNALQKTRGKSIEDSNKSAEEYKREVNILNKQIAVFHTRLHRNVKRIKFVKQKINGLKCDKKQLQKEIEHKTIII
eukprot:123228_1